KVKGVEVMTGNNGKAPKRRVQVINGVVRVYEDHPYWDKEKKQCRHRRTYIGRQDAHGNFIPNKSYLAGQASSANETIKAAERRFFGTGFLLDHIGKVTGVEKDIALSFPEQKDQLVSLIYFLVQEGESAVYRFPRWMVSHWHRLKYVLGSQGISRLFGTISEEAKFDFFRRQAKRRLEKEYLAYDTTSISSYSELLKQVRYGRNKDGERLPQINLAMVFGEESGLPVYFRKLPGNINDVSTMEKMIADAAFLELSKVKLVWDLGFYSAKNVNTLYHAHYKFIGGLRPDTKLARESVEAVRNDIVFYSNYLEGDDAYCVSKSVKWDYFWRHRNGREESGTRRLYVHVYYNEQRAAAERADFNRELRELKEAVLNGKATESQVERAKLFLDIKSTPVRGVKVEYNDEAIHVQTRDFGYFVLISNDLKAGGAALECYRNKDMVEKTFNNLKNRLDFKRTLVSSAENLEGKLFAEFVALIYIAYIHKVMKAENLYRNYSIQSLLDELDVIERFDYAGQRIHYGEITEKQRKIYEAFGILAPDGIPSKAWASRNKNSQLPST
ncbi:MAG: IS1634 family transposase, partial [Victivallaceae bacterium]